MTSLQWQAEQPAWSFGDELSGHGAEVIDWASLATRYSTATAPRFGWRGLWTGDTHAISGVGDWLLARYVPFGGEHVRPVLRFLRQTRQPTSLRGGVSATAVPGLDPVVSFAAGVGGRHSASVDVEGAMDVSRRRLQHVTLHAATIDDRTSFTFRRQGPTMTFSAFGAFGRRPTWQRTVPDEIDTEPYSPHFYEAVASEVLRASRHQLRVLQEKVESLRLPQHPLLVPPPSPPPLSSRDVTATADLLLGEARREGIAAAADLLVVPEARRRPYIRVGGGVTLRTDPLPGAMPFVGVAGELTDRTTIAAHSDALHRTCVTLTAVLSERWTAACRLRCNLITFAQTTFDAGVVYTRPVPPPPWWAAAFPSEHPSSPTTRAWWQRQPAHLRDTPVAAAVPVRSGHPTLAWEAFLRSGDTPTEGHSDASSGAAAVGAEALHPKVEELRRSLHLRGQQWRAAAVATTTAQGSGSLPVSFVSLRASIVYDRVNAGVVIGDVVGLAAAFVGRILEPRIAAAILQSRNVASCSAFRTADGSGTKENAQAAAAKGQPVVPSPWEKLLYGASVNLRRASQAMGPVRVVLGATWSPGMLTDGPRTVPTPKLIFTVTL